MPFDALVDDILVDVVHWLDRPRDVVNFGLTSRRIWPRVTPVLYADLSLIGTECTSVLDMLSANPRLASHVHSLKLHASEDALVGVENLSQTVADIAEHMHALHTFHWGVISTSTETMWKRLRLHCPALVNIGISFCETLPETESSLYAFDNLRSFHLTLSRLYFSSHEDDEDVRWAPFWSLLRERCPDLQELTIDGAGERPVTVQQLVGCRWPNLHKLHLGDIATERVTPALLDPGSKRLFLQFLEAHDQLTDLQLSGKVGHPPASFSAMSRQALPMLRHFGGSIFQISTLRCYSSLQSLHITEPLYLRGGIIEGIAQVLSHFRSIQTLRLAFIVDEDSAEQDDMLRAVFKACPQLFHLHLKIRHSSLSLSQFAILARDLLPMLKTLTLFLADLHGVDLVTVGAVHIATAFPWLQTFYIGFLGRGDSRGRQDILVPVRFGEYEILRDPGGHPRLLLICEGTRAQKLTSPSDMARTGYRRRFFLSRGWFYYDVHWSRYTFPTVGLPLPTIPMRRHERTLGFTWSPLIVVFVAILLFRLMLG